MVDGDAAVMAHSICYRRLPSAWAGMLLHGGGRYRMSVPCRPVLCCRRRGAPLAGELAILGRRRCPRRRGCLTGRSSLPTVCRNPACAVAVRGGAGVRRVWPIDAIRPWPWRRSRIHAAARYAAMVAGVWHSGTPVLHQGLGVRCSGAPGHARTMRAPSCATWVAVARLSWMDCVYVFF